MTMTWSIMTNSQRRTDKIDSDTIISEKMKMPVKNNFFVWHIGIVRWKVVDIEGVKIQFKNMTMLTWSTTVKSHIRTQMYLNKNENYYKFKYPVHIQKSRTQMYLNKNETYYKFKYPTHIFRSEELILKGNC